MNRWRVLRNRRGVSYHMHWFHTRTTIIRLCPCPVSHRLISLCNHINTVCTAFLSAIRILQVFFSQNYRWMDNFLTQRSVVDAICDHRHEFTAIKEVASGKQGWNRKFAESPSSSYIWLTYFLDTDVSAIISRPIFPECFRPPAHIYRFKLASSRIDFLKKRCKIWLAASNTSFIAALTNDPVSVMSETRNPSSLYSVS